MRRRSRHGYATSWPSAPHRSIAGQITSDQLPVGAVVTDMIADEEIGEVHEDHGFPIQLKPHQGRSLLIDPTQFR